MDGDVAEEGCVQGSDRIHEASKDHPAVFSCEAELIFAIEDATNLSADGLVEAHQRGDGFACPRVPEVVIFVDIVWCIPSAL